MTESFLILLAGGVMLAAAISDPKQVEFLLMAVDTLDSKRGAIRDNDHFAQLFCQEIGYTGLNRHEVGGVLILFGLYAMPISCTVMTGA